MFNSYPPHNQKTSTHTHRRWRWGQTIASLWRITWSKEGQTEYQSASITCFGLVTCPVKGWQLKTGCPVEDYFKLWVLKFTKVNPCAHVVANLVSKMRPQNRQKLRISWENQDFPSPKLQFSSRKIQYSSTAFQFSSTAFSFLQQLSGFLQQLSKFLQWLSDFRQWLSAFRNAFLLSSTPFYFPQRLSNFPQRLSNFPQRLSTFQEIQENLFMVASIQNITIWASYFPPLALRAL